MSYSREKSQPIFDRALNVLVKGVSSNFRFLGEKETPVIVKGKGAHVWDADDNEFIDYRLGWGPIILGHADDRVNQAVTEHLENGTTFAATSELEVIVAEKLVKMIPGMEKLRFTNTGTEATMHALRTARGFTNKEKFIKFEGQYHGAHDYVLFSTASSPISAMEPAHLRFLFKLDLGSQIKYEIMFTVYRSMILKQWSNALKITMVNLVRFLWNHVWVI